MKLWIVSHLNQYGIGSFPMWAEKMPSLKEQGVALAKYLADEGMPAYKHCTDTLELFGPFDILGIRK